MLAARRSIFSNSFSVRTFCARRPLRFLVTPLLSAVAKHASDSSQELRPASSLSDSMIMGRQSRLPCMDADWPLLVNTKLVTKVAGLTGVGTKQKKGEYRKLK